jgi:hypothetical protein
MSRRSLNTLGDPHALSYELGTTARQRLWRTCCGSTDEHRFDCQAVEPEKRGEGPFGPVTPATPGELIAGLRSP